MKKNYIKCKNKIWSIIFKNIYEIKKKIYWSVVNIIYLKVIFKNNIELMYELIK